MTRLQVWGIRARRLAGLALAAAAVAVPAIVLAAPQDQGYVPVTQLPPRETLPATPLVFAAYAFVWIALVVYVFTLWRRLGKVERELSEAKRSLLQPAGRR